MDEQDKKILVVEDDDVMRKIIVDQLAGRFVVIQATDGAEALNLIEADHPDIIILDLLLPKIDGREVLAQLRTMPVPELSQIPVIVFSNLSDENVIMQVKQYGIEAYFIKADISFGILVNRVKRILANGPTYGKDM